MTESSLSSLENNIIRIVAHEEMIKVYTMKMFVKSIIELSVDLSSMPFFLILSAFKYMKFDVISVLF